MKILAAEDDAVTRCLLQKLLTGWGYEVVTACDGNEAWDVLSSPESPPLVILDWIMPGLNGIEICRKKEGLANKSPVYVILLTGNRDEKDLVAGFQAGANDFIAKPFRTGELRARVAAGERIINLQRELVRERILFRILMDSIPASIYFKDKTGRFFRINQFMAKHLGLKEMTQALGKTDFDYFTWEHARQAYLDEQRIQESGVPTVDKEEKETWPGGKVTWVSTSKMPLRDPEQGIVGTFGISTDITARKQAEEALLKAHREMSQLVSLIPFVIIQVDDGGLITQWNRTATETFGIPPSAAIGRRLEECAIRWDFATVKREVARNQGEKRLFRVDDVRFTRRDGKEGLLSITVSFFGKQANWQDGYILSAADYTEHRMLENQLRHAQRLESIGQLAAGIAHEINTPTQYVGDNVRFLQECTQGLLTAVDNCRKLLAANQSNETTTQFYSCLESSFETLDIDYLHEEIPKAIQQATEGLERICCIVRSMRDFSAPGDNEKRATDLNRTIESTITVASNEWKYVAEVITELDASLPLVPCYAAELNQVILNLLINAAHAITQKFGQTGEKGVIQVKTEKVSDCVEIRVSDTGIGIPQPLHSKIFDPFFTTKEVGKGIGQGLTFAHRVVVEKHGGSITFETELGRGTEFIIRLPMAELPVECS